MAWKALLAVSISLSSTACETGGLDSLALEGTQLHASLETPQIDEIVRLHVPRAVLMTNPQVSTNPEFVEAIAGGGSQGRLGGDGIRAALYALYRGENDLGLYGLEAESVAEAEERESLVREIWAHNASLDRARVHRVGRVVVVVWTDGVTTAIWDAVNAVVAEHLGA